MTTKRGRERDRTSARSEPDAGPRAAGRTRRTEHGAAPAEVATGSRSRRIGTIVVWVLIAAYVALFFGACVVKYRAYLYTDFDLAIFTQATDRLMHGSLWSSIRGMNWLGDHSSLILFAIAPLHALFPSPLTLLFVQTVALALGGLATYWLARRELSGEIAPVLFAAVWLLHPAIGYTNLFEFHPETLATSLLLFTFLFVRESRSALAIVCASGALLCKEDVALVIGALACYALLLGPARRRLAATLGGLAALSFLISFAILKPAFSGGVVDYGRMYTQWGSSPGSVVVNVITHPIEAVSAFFADPIDPQVTRIKRLYHIHLLLPVLFLPLLEPLVLVIALPVLAEHFLSQRWQQQTIVAQYTALITPFVMAAAVIGAARLERWLAGERRRGAEKSSRSRAPAAPRPVAARGRRERIATAIAGAALLSSLVSSVLFGPLWGRNVMLPARATERTRPSAYDRTLAPHRDRMAARVPRAGGVVAGFQFLPRLAGRPEIHSIHHVMSGLYTYSMRSYPIPEGIDALIADIGDDGLMSYQGPGSGERLAALVRANRLHPADVAGDQVLLLRAPRDTVELFRAGSFTIGAPETATFDDQLGYAGHDPVDATVAPGGEVTFHTYWRRAGQSDRLYLMDVVLRDSAGEVRASRGRVLCYDLFPLAEWPADSTVRETIRMLAPVDLAPGVYTLALGLRWRGPGGRGQAVPDHPTSADGSIPIGRVTVRSR